jgi:CRISPR-associated endonuclease Csn1
MLKLFYEIIEDKRMGHDVSNKKDLLSREIEDCNIGHNASSIVEFIDNNILINHHTKDRTFFPARREISILDKSGKKVKKIATGDSVRGRLHEETFLGAIKFPKEDGPIMERKPIMRDGHFDYPEDGKDIVMVKRIPLDSNNFKEIKDLEKIIDANLRIIILSAIDKRIKDGLSFKEAIEQGVWMIDKYGNEIHKDKNGRLLCPIRHVRCKVKAGRGYLTFDKSLKIKKQMYSSPKRLVNIPNRNHKGIVYAINDGNYLCLLYEGIKKGAIDRKCRFVNTFEAAELMRSGSYVDLEKDLWKEPYYSSLTDKKIIYKLSAILKVGTRVILWDKNPSEIYDLSKTELSKRLFIILNFNTASSDRIYLRNHLDAKTEGDNEKISLVPSQFNCLIEHRDFEIDELGRITFQNSI